MTGPEDFSVVGFGFKRPKLKQIECSIDMDYFFRIGPFSWVGWVMSSECGWRASSYTSII